MRNQIIEITEQMPFNSSFANRFSRRNITADRNSAYWMHVYPPLTEINSAVPGMRQLCPWAIAAEINDAASPDYRKQQLVEALKTGQRIMKLYGLPAHRIMFMEKGPAKQVTVWVD